MRVTLRARAPMIFEAVLLTLVSTVVAHSQGIVLPAVGPVNRSMAGAATAAPIDATGALHWNPATICGLTESSVDIGVEFLYSRHEVSSVVPANALAPGVPAGDLSGGNDSNSGVSALPAIGLVYKPCLGCFRSSSSPGHCSGDSRWTFGLGINAIGGFYINYPASQSNPILTPQPPNGVGLGNIYGRLGLLQVAPTASLQLSERVAVGFAPTVTIADLQVDPFGFVAPDDTNGDGFATYPPATHGRLNYGLGFQVGIYMTTQKNLNFGLSLKSPQWFEEFKYNAVDELGGPRTITTDIDYPLIISFGSSYTGWSGWLLAVDVRWVDYQTADAFGDPSGFDSSGAATGLGWDSVFLVGLGAQYELNDVIALRAGYSYNQNPIPDGETFFSLAASGIFQHVLNLGASLDLTRDITMTAAWVHGFENSIEGPFVVPGGAVLGTTVRTTQETDHLALGLTVHF